MKQHTPQAGDVVQLLSGGPPMTVMSIEDGDAQCVWFDNDARMASWVFPVNVVVLHSATALAGTVEGLQRRGSDKMGVISAERQLESA